MRVAILGGTGKFGRGLAVRLAATGHGVTIGSRSEGRGAATAAELGVDGTSNRLAAGRADLVVMAVEAYAALDTAREIRPCLRVPLLSVASQIDFAAGRAFPIPGPSVAEQISEIVDVPVVAGLHSLAAGKLVERAPDEDAFVCGSDEESKLLALELAGDVVAGRAIDCGGLSVARALEAMTAVLLNVNRRYKTHAGIRLTGLP